MIRGAATATGDPAITEAAAAALEAGGGAVDAVVAGFAMASALDAGVLLAPAIALVAGMGVGDRAFDGRATQPGRNGQRPRGLVEGAPVPDGARVAAPRTPAMLALLHGYRGRARLPALFAPAAARAAQIGAKVRADLLRHLGDGGPLLMHRAAVIRALLAAGGPIAGGALTEDDLKDAIPAEVEATRTPLAEGAAVLCPPWPAGEGGARAIAAADMHGVVAVLAYAPSDDPVHVPQLELAIGKHAEPVRRGVQRVQPGTPIPAPGPIAVLARGGGYHAAIAAAGRSSLEPAELAVLVGELAIEGALSSLGAVAAIFDGRACRAL